MSTFGKLTWIENKKRKFGSANEYAYVRVRVPGGPVANLLLTYEEYKVALHRAYSNPEDVPPPPPASFWERLFPWLVVMVLAITPGCANLGTVKKEEKTATESAASLAATNALVLSRVVEGDRAPVPVVASPVTVTSPPITVSGTNNRVDIRMDQPRHQLPQRLTPAQIATATPYREELNVNASAGQVAGDSESMTRSFKVSPALWLTLAGSGLGLILLSWGVRAWRAQSVAIDAAFRSGDAALNEIGQRLKSAALSTTDPTELARINARYADVESQRGKLAASRVKQQ